MTRRKRYSVEFKREALRRANEEGVTDTLVAEELGLTKASNLLDQNFSAVTVNERWASDITCNMSGKGSCYDNAVVGSFFASLKRERTRRNKYRTRDEARADVFDYIERFYNRKRRHGYVGNISPVLFENRTLGLNSGLHQT